MLNLVWLFGSLCIAVGKDLVVAMQSVFFSFAQVKDRIQMRLLLQNAS